MALGVVVAATAAGGESAADVCLKRGYRAGSATFYQCLEDMRRQGALGGLESLTPAESAEAVPPGRGTAEPPLSAAGENDSWIEQLDDLGDMTPAGEGASEPRQW